ncbi:hypothetical protein CVT24_000343 [Panaeolus cyanescens]|uniref:Uncharacterized protein n=1 Tax=Panaeolus cyanescens TaxID=181874 RepID=A0A409YCZ7_9AGAR|nr:hypothetical protein CVT24_000343 [Panaeolus cyanescens]
MRTATFITHDGPFTLSVFSRYHHWPQQLAITFNTSDKRLHPEETIYIPLKLQYGIRQYITRHKVETIPNVTFKVDERKWGGKEGSRQYHTRQEILYISNTIGYVFSYIFATIPGLNHLTIVYINSSRERAPIFSLDAISFNFKHHCRSPWTKYLQTITTVFEVPCSHYDCAKFYAMGMLFEMANPRVYPRLAQFGIFVGVKGPSYHWERQYNLYRELFDVVVACVSVARRWCKVRGCIELLEPSNLAMTARSSNPIPLQQPATQTPSNLPSNSPSSIRIVKTPSTPKQLTAECHSNSPQNTPPASKEAPNTNCRKRKRPAVDSAEKEWKEPETSEAHIDSTHPRTEDVENGASLRSKSVKDDDEEVEEKENSTYKKAKLT